MNNPSNWMLRSGLIIQANDANYIYSEEAAKYFGGVIKLPKSDLYKLVQIITSVSVFIFSFFRLTNIPILQNKILELGKELNIPDWIIGLFLGAAMAVYVALGLEAFYRLAKYKEYRFINKYLISSTFIMIGLGILYWFYKINTATFFFVLGLLWNFLLDWIFDLIKRPYKIFKN